jgi:hypothetical protein
LGVELLKSPAGTIAVRKGLELRSLASICDNLETLEALGCTAMFATYLLSNASAREYNTTGIGQQTANMLRELKFVHLPTYLMVESLAKIPCPSSTQVPAEDTSRNKHPRIASASEEELNKLKDKVRKYYRQKISEGTFTNLTNITRAPWSMWSIINGPELTKQWSAVNTFSKDDCNIVLASTDFSFEFKDEARQSRVKVKRAYVERAYRTTDVRDLELVDPCNWVIQLSSGFPTTVRPGWRDLNRFSIEDCTKILSATHALVFCSV